MEEEEEEEEISVGLENNGRRFRLFLKKKDDGEKWRGNEGASVISVHTYVHM